MKTREEILSAIRAVLSAETDDFAELVAIAGLDPKTHFIAANLRGVDFGNADLTLFDLEGAVTDGAVFGQSIQPQPQNTEPTPAERQALITDIFDGIGHSGNSLEGQKGGVESSAYLVGNLENLLNAEARFVSRLRVRASEMCKIRTEVESVQSALSNDRVVQIARFFFLVQAYACDTPEAVEKLLDSHNEKISSFLASGGIRQRSNSELKKALFTDPQISMCVGAVRVNRRGVFTRSEIASLMVEHMGRDSANRILDLLVRAGLLFEHVWEPPGGPRRIQILTDGFLENTVSDYLSELVGAATYQGHVRAGSNGR